MEAKKFGLIGHPVGHSLSAAMHGKVFEELGLPHTYEAFDVLPENLEEFVRNTDLDGANVTIPHKVEVMKYVDRLEKSAKDVRAVNTIHFGEEKVGHNTDGVGFSRSLEEKAVNPKERNVLVVGSGGVSRAILAQLVQDNANITLTNRTRKKAEALIEELNLQDKIKIIDYNPENITQALKDTYLVINTTSIGMHPNIDYSPVPKEALKKEHVVFDAVYNPIETKLIKDAKEIGCKTISGVGMLVHQGAESSRIWLGIDPPIETMRKVLIDALS
jgi:shikimate dehydrogenase